MDTTKKPQKTTHLICGSTATGCGAWGSGASQAKALTSFRRSGGDTNRPMYLYEFGLDTIYRGVRADGFLTYDGPAPSGRPFTLP